MRLIHAIVGRHVDPDAAFARLYADAPVAFWLDACPHGGFGGRWSVMGDARGPRAERLIADAAADRVARVRGGVREDLGVGLFVHLRAALGNAPEDSPDAPPFPFRGGYAGYLGYEMKAALARRTSARPAYPDAQLIFADRFLAFDHETGDVHAAALGESDTEEDAARAWFDAVRAALDGLPPARLDLDGLTPREPAIGWRHDRAAYRALIERCQADSLDGESYEICLTNEATLAAAPIDPLTAYRVLRAINPAPHAAYLRFDDLAVLCSSPERFLRADAEGMLETKPIKGTRRRGADAAEDAALAADLAASEKDRAENLMITDLLRNDLGAVCAVGSVHVPVLMEVETFPSLHQLVSTVRGRLDEGRSIVDALAALFPGGSMTGAPKIRTMEIIDRLENGPRGVYSGTIGWLGLDGAADLNIVIRTLVMHAGTLTAGSGGAITALSDPDAEIAEVELKAAALIRAVGLTRALSDGDAV